MCAKNRLQTGILISLNSAMSGLDFNILVSFNNAPVSLHSALVSRFMVSSQ